MESLIYLWPISPVHVTPAIFFTPLFRAVITRGPALASFLFGSALFSSSLLAHVFSLPLKLSVFSNCYDAANFTRFWISPDVAAENAVWHGSPHPVFPGVTNARHLR